MTVYEILALFGIMSLLAAMPSSSVALVVARSAGRGFADGAAVSAGVVTGDLVFILLTLTGLAALASVMGSFFLVIKYLAAAYLIWLGVNLLLSARNNREAARPIPEDRRTSLLSSYTAGLFLTLGDIKAIYFYLGLLPTFIDLHALSAMDVFIVCMITTFAVGGVKLIYASMAQSVMRVAGSRHEAAVSVLAGGAIAGAGCYLLVKD